MTQQQISYEHITGSFTSDPIIPLESSSKNMKRAASYVVSPDNSTTALDRLCHPSNDDQAYDSSCFNFTDLLATTQQSVQFSPGFPVIEWDSDSENDEHDDDDELPRNCEASRALNDLLREKENNTNEDIFRSNNPRKRSLASSNRFIRTKCQKSRLNDLSSCQHQQSSCPPSSSTDLSSIPILYGPASEALDGKDQARVHVSHNNPTQKTTWSKKKKSCCENSSKPLASLVDGWGHFVSDQ